MSGAALLLLADSQLLFRPEQLPQLVQRFASRPAGSVTAAYIGAANGHQPEFFALACSALETLLGTAVPCHCIRSVQDLPPQPVEVLVLAGGSVQAGWEFLRQPAVHDWLQRCHAQTGAVIIGVSAGAIHLASGYDPEMSPPQPQTCLGWAPLFVAAHEERDGWPSQRIWQAGDLALDFCGLLLGGGVWIEQGVQLPVGKGMVCVRRQTDSRRPNNPAGN